MVGFSMAMLNSQRVNWSFQMGKTSPPALQFDEIQRLTMMNITVPDPVAVTEAGVMSQQAD